MKIEIDGISITPEFFSKIIQLLYDEINSKRNVRPEQISNIKIKDITKDEIIIQLNFNPIPCYTNIFEITIPKEKTLKPIEGACEHLIMREFNVKLLESIDRKL